MRDPLYHDAALAAFYDRENPWGADQAFCLNLAANANSLLDLCCGTGSLAAAIASESKVHGVDGADAMLAIARSRPGGSAVVWHQADVRTLRLDRKFDLITVIGHSFQSFLSDADQSSLFTTIAAHLSPTGRFIFDTRNPADRAWTRWSKPRRFQDAALGQIAARTNVEPSARLPIISFRTTHTIERTDTELTASSKLRFTSKTEIERRATNAGLFIEKWFGNWHGQAWSADAPEIIPLGRLA